MMCRMACHSCQCSWHLPREKSPPAPGFADWNASVGRTITIWPRSAPHPVGRRPRQAL